MAKKKTKVDDITKIGTAPLKGLNYQGQQGYSDEFKTLLGMKRAGMFQSSATQSLKSTGLPVETREGFGDSMFDPSGMVSEADYANFSNIRAENQPWIAQVGAGVGKMVTTAATTFINNTAGILDGLYEWGKTSDPSKLWNNPVTNTMKEFSDTMENVLPNYYTEYAQEHPFGDSVGGFFGNLISGNFLGDKLIKNLGFVIGTVYSGGLWGKGVGLVGQGLTKLLGAGANLASKGSRLANAMDAVTSFSASATPITASAVATFTGALGEASLEALTNYQDFVKDNTQAVKLRSRAALDELQDKYSSGLISANEFDYGVSHIKEVEQQTLDRIEEDATKSANRTLVANLPFIWGADALMFGKLFKNNFSTAKRLERTRPKHVTGSLEEGKYGTDFTTRGKIWEIGKVPLSEGGQEFSQSVITEATLKAYTQDVADYYKAALDKESYQENIDWMNTIGEALYTKVNDPTAWEEFTLGALTAIVGFPKVGIRTDSKDKKGLGLSWQNSIFQNIAEYNRDKAETEKNVEALNARIGTPEFKTYWEYMARHKYRERAKIGDLDKDDKFSYENNNESQTIEDIELFSKLGRLSDLAEAIKKASNLDDTGVEDLLKQAEPKNTNTEQEIKDIQKEREALDENITKAQALLDITEQVLESDLGNETALKNKDVFTNNIEVWNTQKSLLDSREKNLKKSRNEFSDENGNVLSNKEIKEKVKKNGEDLLKYIRDYQQARNYVSSLIDRGFSEKSLDYLTYLQMIINNAPQRANSLFNERLKDSIKALLEETETYLKDSTLTEKQRKGFENQKKVLNDILSSKNPYSLASQIYKDTEFLEGLINTVKDSEVISELNKDKTVRDMQDFAKIANRADEVREHLRDLINNPEKANKMHGEAKKKAVEAEINSAKKSLEDKVKNIKSVRDAEKLIRENGGYKKHIEDLLNNSDNEDIQKINKRRKLVNEAQARVRGNDKMEDKDKIAALRLIEKLKDSDKQIDDLTPEDLVKEIREVTSSATDSQAQKALDKIAKVTETVRKLLHEVQDDLDESAAIRARKSEREASEKSEKSGKDGAPSQKALNADRGKSEDKKRDSEQKSSTPKYSVEKARTIMEQDEEKSNDEKKKQNKESHSLAPLTKELPNGFNSLDDYIDSLNKGRKTALAKKISAVREYFISHGVFDFVNLGGIELKEEVFFIIDNSLNENAGTVVPLMAVKRGDLYQVIGDLPTLLDKQYLEDNPEYNTIVSLILEEYKNSEDKSFFVSSLTSHINNKYIGKQNRTANKENISLDTVWTSDETPVIGVIRNNEIEVSNSKTIIPNAIVKGGDYEGHTVILIPTSQKDNKGRRVAMPQILFRNKFSISEREELSNKETWYNKIDSIIRNVFSAKDQKTAKNLFNSLYDYLDLHNTGNIKSVSFINSSDGFTLEVTYQDDNTVIYASADSFIKSLEGTLFNISIKKLKDEDYVKGIKYHTKVDLKPGTTHTVSDWFGINSLDKDGKELQGKRFSSITVNTKKKHSNTTEVEYKGVTYNVDLKNGKIYTTDNKELTDTQKQVIYTKAWCDYVYGDKIEDVNLFNNIAKLPNGEWFDRNTDKFVKEPKAEDKKKKTEKKEDSKKDKEKENDENKEAVDIIEEAVSKIQTKAKNIKLVDDKYYFDKITRESFLRTTTFIEADERETPFDELSKYAAPSTAIGNSVDLLTRDFFKSKERREFLYRLSESENSTYGALSNKSLKRVLKRLEQLEKELEGYTIVSEGITVAGKIKIIGTDGNPKFVNVAGTLDLLAYDKNGNVLIIDTKTHRGDFREEHWRRQLSVYKELLKQNGLNVTGLRIFPVKTSYPTPEGVTEQGKEGTTKYEKKDSITLTVASSEINEGQETNISKAMDVVPEEALKEDAVLEEDIIDLNIKEDKLKVPSVINVFSTPETDEGSKVETKATEETPKLETPEAKPKRRNVRNKRDERQSFKREVEQGSRNPIWNQKQEMEWLEKLFPNLSKEERVSIVNGLIKTTDGTAYGMFVNGLIYLSDVAARGTAYHEAFHYVSQALMSDYEREELYSMARKKFGNLNDLEIEEALAEDFRIYTQRVEYSTPFVRFFRKLWNMIKTLNGRRNTLSSLYYNINKGRYSTRTSNTRFSNTALSRKEEYSSEMNSIMKKAKADGTFMKAPNGKPTNLTERQWLQVRTRNFINWFGDWINNPDNASKVVDGNGEPLVVYHHTDANISTFDKNKTKDTLFYFTSDKYGENIYYPNSNPYVTSPSYNNTPVFLNLRNPSIVSNSRRMYSISDFQKMSELRKEMYELTNKRRSSEESARLKDITKKYNSIRLARVQTDFVVGNEVLNYMNSHNNDGFIVDWLDNEKFFAVSMSNQIKSADSNIGDFSTTNDDIRYRKVEEGYDSILKQYYREKLEYHNLSKADLSILEEMELSEEDWDNIPDEVKESILHCRR